MRYTILTLFLLLSAFSIFGMQMAPVVLQKKIEEVVAVHQELGDQLDALGTMSWTSLAADKHIEMYHKLEKKLRSYYEMADVLIKLNNPKIKNAIHDINFITCQSIMSFLDAYELGQKKRNSLLVSLNLMSECSRKAREALRKQHMKPWLQPEEVLQEEIKEQTDLDMLSVPLTNPLLLIAPE